MANARARRRHRRRRQESERAQWQAMLRQAVRDARRPVRIPPARDPATGQGAIDHGALWPVIRQIDRSDFGVWEIAAGLNLTPDEREMIRKAVARYLPGNA
jgi:hypothetical protein